MSALFIFRSFFESLLQIANINYYVYNTGIELYKLVKAIKSTLIMN